MDKSTLSNYGWIVIVTLVLSVMLAFATPFGTYIGQAVSNSVKYYKNVTGDVFSADYLEEEGDQWDTFLNTGDNTLISFYGVSSGKLNKKAFANWATSATKVKFIDGYGSNLTITDNPSLCTVDSRYALSVSEESTRVVAYLVTEGDDIVLYIASISGPIKANQNSSRVFYNLSNVKSIDFNDCFIVTDVTYFESFFGGCESLETIDVSFFDTSSGKTFSSMFANCKKLKELNVDNFDMSSAQNLAYMFAHCEALESIDVSNFDTSKVQTATGIFQHCYTIEELDLSSWNTSNLTGAITLVHYCKNLKTINLANWNTTKLKNICDGFSDCISLEVLDLSGWDTRNTEVVSLLFRNNTSLKHVYVGEHWDTTLASQSTGKIIGGTDAMFENCGISEVEKIA